MSSIVIPEKVFDQHIIVLGKTRSGKSSAMRYLVEHLLDESKPVCIIDPKGDWWGIKSSATGKSSGGRLELTNAGREIAGIVDYALTSEQIQKRALQILTPYQSDLLNAAIGAGGETISVEDLAERAGKQVTSSTFDKYLASLCGAEMIERTAPRMVRAAPWLFLGGS
ncbi:MAG: helicase HerA domain-containing protein [Candidatus Acidiferrales bacterium]